MGILRLVQRDAKYLVLAFLFIWVLALAYMGSTVGGDVEEEAGLRRRQHSRRRGGGGGGDSARLAFLQGELRALQEEDLETVADVVQHELQALRHAKEAAQEETLHGARVRNGQSRRRRRLRGQSEDDDDDSDTDASGSDSGDDEEAPAPAKHGKHRRHRSEKKTAAPATPQPAARRRRRRRPVVDADSDSDDSEDDASSAEAGGNARGVGRVGRSGGGKKETKKGVVEDHAVKAHPGGTEREAVLSRRKLGDLNWPVSGGHTGLAWGLEEEAAAGHEAELPASVVENAERSPALASVHAAAMRACRGEEDDEEEEETRGNKKKKQKQKKGAPAHARVDVACYQRRYHRLMEEARGGSLGDGPAFCSGVYSYPSVELFKKNRVDVCGKADLGPSSEGSLRSGMVCFARRLRGHTSDTAVCEGRNVVLSYDLMPPARDYPWLDFKKGAFAGKCEPAPGMAPERFKEMFMQCIADWFVKGIKQGGGGPELDVDADCDEYVETPTYFVTRAGDYSPFHIAHDTTNAFLSAAILGFNFQDLQVVIHDRMTKGFYLPLWQWVYSSGHKLLWYPDLREKYKSKRVCYRRAIFNVPARLSLLYNNHEPCITTASSTLRAWSDYVLGAFDLASLAPKRSVLSVTLIVRRNYKTGHAIGRRFGNEEEVVAMLRSLRVEGWEVVVNPMDYAVYDFDKQMQLSRSTDVLIAMHGAGLIQMSFLPGWGGVFEFFCPEKPSSNFRYKHLAGYYGLRYNSYSIADVQNTVPIPAAKERVSKLLADVAAAKTRFHSSAAADSDDSDNDSDSNADSSDDGSE